MSSSIPMTDSSSAPKTSSDVTPMAIPFWIHSTFRNKGQQVKPYGLEWGIDGDSYMTFVPAVEEDVTPQNLDLNSLECRHGIIKAYNRWAFSKEEPFKGMQDLKSLTWDDENNKQHVHVTWNPPTFEPFKYSIPDDMEIWLKQTATKRATECDGNATRSNTPEVWINGILEGTLDGEMSLFPLLMAIKRVQGPGTTLCVRETKNLIRIEKFFRGMLRKQQVFEHIMDNLIAMEDPQVIDAQKMICTATLPDWIMGGQLTSRLYIEELENGNIKFGRPLYNDDIGTSDRHFDLHKGRDDEKINMVQKELKRLRHLALLKHPFSAKLEKDDTIPACMNLASNFEVTNLFVEKMEDPFGDETGSTSSSIVVHESNF